MGIKKIIIGGVVSVGVGAGFLGGKVHEQTLSPSEKVEREGKRMIAYDPSSFGKAGVVPGQVGMSSLSAGYTSFVVKDESEVPAGFKVVEDRKYKLEFLKGCVKDPAPPADPLPPEQQTIPWGIKKVRALEAHTVTKAEGVVVCIADTGTDFDHPDLKDTLIGGTSHVPGNDSWDDDQGHGTHVAGTVAAQINSIDVVGVSQAKIFTTKVLDQDGSGYGSWIAEGIVSCVNNGAQIISMSLGSPAQYGPDPLIADAIKWALESGVYVVAAAGNDGGAVGYPAAQDGVIAVSASDEYDNIAYFSSRGPEIDIMAPGVNVLSTRRGGGVVSYSGTSMATPHVSGALALALSVGKKLKAVDVGLKQSEQGIGRLDAMKTVSE